MHSAPEGSPAAERNKSPIWETLSEVLAHREVDHHSFRPRLLEVASGTGQHIAYFGVRLSQWVLQPSDMNATRFPLITQWVEYEGAHNVLPPTLLDVRTHAEQWPEGSWDVIYAANMTPLALGRRPLGYFKEQLKNFLPKAY